MATGNCKTHPVAAKVLIGKLKDCEDKLNAVIYNQDARDACFTNLQRQENDVKSYEKGAVEELENGKDCKINLDTCSLRDHLQVSWEGSALELIVHMLLIFYGDRENTGKVSPIIDPQLEEIGTSFSTNKRHGQLFQIIYISKIKVDKP